MTDRRPITAAVRRRAWGELGVRPWTFLTLLLLTAAIGLAGSRWGAWKREKTVIETGTPVTAEVVAIGIGQAAREGSRDEPLTVGLRYTPPESASPLEAWGTLPRKPGTSIGLKDTLRVRVDPQHPEYWTERAEPAPLTLVMVTPLLSAGVALGCGLIALARRGGAIRAYRTAEPQRATVVSVRQSPLAPLSKLLGVTLDDGDDRRVRDCYWPNRAGTIHPQQPIEVLVGGRRTFATAAYQLPPHVMPGGGMEG